MEPAQARTNRAIAALSTFVRNDSLLATNAGAITFASETGCDATGAIRFWQDEAKTTEALTDADAHFIEVSDEVRPQDRAHLFGRLLGSRAARLPTWVFVRDHWAEGVAPLDPMLQQNFVRALAQLTPEPTASEVRAFLPTRATDETHETISQTIEQLGIDAAVCRRLMPAVTTALRQVV